MNAYRKIFLKVIAILLVVIVGIHSLNSIFYTHSHKLGDGTIITHAHPFDTSSDSDPFKSHKHSSLELIFLANLIYFLQVALIALAGITVLSDNGYSDFLKSFTEQSRFQSIHLRGPPTRF